MNNTPKTVVQSIRLAYWNANGLENKKLELKEFMSRKEIDVMLIGETWLKDCKKFKIPNYCTYRNDRKEQPKGGTAILIKKHIKHHQLISTPGPIENTDILIPTEKGNLKIISTYCSPKRTLTQTALDNLLRDSCPTILLGDLNAKHKSWGCNHNNTSGIALLRYTQGNNVLLHTPSDPTHYGEKGRPDILDICLSKNVLQKIEIESLPELSSDHNPIITELNFKTTKIPTEIKKINWTKFHFYLRNNTAVIKQLNTMQEIDREIETMTKEIQAAIEQATKRTQKTQEFRQSIPQQLKLLIQEKRKAKKKWQRTLDPQDLRLATQLNNEVKRSLIDHRNEKWQNRLQEIEEEQTPNPMWKLTKTLRTKLITIPPLLHENKHVITNEDKAETLAKSIEAQCSPNPVVDEEHEQNILQIIAEALAENDETSTRPASFEEITNIIRRSKNRKAPGRDEITNNALKHAPKKTIVKLLNIINASLRMSYFPTPWKQAIIITIPKPGKNHQLPENHRPISLLSTPAKIYERIILTRLTDHLDENQTIPDEQFGFRPTLSSELQTLRIVEKISESLEKKDTTAAIFLDVSKAFDKVWHDGLIYKLIRAQIPRKFVKLIECYLKNRTFQVKVENCLSQTRRTTAGVPQGSVLGPVLYNIYTSDLPRTPGTELALYADDTAITSNSRCPVHAARNLQTAIDNLEEWFETWKIKINPNKSQAVLYTKRRGPNPEQLQIENTRIPWKDHAKYLGIEIDSKLTWNRQIDSLRKKGAIAIKELYPMLKSNKLSLSTKRLIYTSIIRPTITYGYSIWGHAAKTNINKIQIMQNKTLRIITGAPWFVRNTQLHADLKIQTIKTWGKTQATQTYLRAETNPNPLIRDAVNYNPEVVKKRPKIVTI